VATTTSIKFVILPLCISLLDISGTTADAPPTV